MENAFEWLNNFFFIAHHGGKPRELVTSSGGGKSWRIFLSREWFSPKLHRSYGHFTIFGNFLYFRLPPRTTALPPTLPRPGKNTFLARFRIRSSSPKLGDRIFPGEETDLGSRNSFSSTHLPPSPREEGILLTFFLRAFVVRSSPRTSCLPLSRGEFSGL